MMIWARTVPDLAQDAPREVFGTIRAQLCEGATVERVLARGVRLLQEVLTDVGSSDVSASAQPGLGDQSD